MEVVDSEGAQSQNFFFHQEMAEIAAGICPACFAGAVGIEWFFVGFENFFANGETAVRGPESAVAGHACGVGAVKHIDAAFDAFE